jgi:hypothetical protein
MVRFGSGVVIRMHGIARADQWMSAFSQFRAARDGVALRGQTGGWRGRPLRRLTVFLSTLRDLSRIRRALIAGIEFRRSAQQICVILGGL